MVFQTLLEMFVLVGISSHLSKLLIVFTELTEVPRSVSSKYTVVGIISGVPLITVFGNHLTYKTMNLKLRSWWLMENSLALNIFLIVIVIVTMLFIFIYFSVTNKLGKLIVSRKKHEVTVKKRLSLVRRASCLFGLILIFVVSSILYINNQKLVWIIYQFAGVNVLLASIFGN
uniref:G-protein coupled receptors family 1 profile domain-containing protein n=1 Tax=Dendroctonus ponderosae TaxID=77166 RepID=A0AAR5P0Q2_DENPD